MLELDGSWRNPDYIKGSAGSEKGAENVFCLSLSAASEMLNMTLRMPIAEEWWPEQEGVERNFVTGRTKKRIGGCHKNCSVSQQKWAGDDAGAILYLRDRDVRPGFAVLNGVANIFRRLVRL